MAGQDPAAAGEADAPEDDDDEEPDDAEPVPLDEPESFELLLLLLLPPFAPPARESVR